MIYLMNYILNHCYVLALTKTPYILQAFSSRIQERKAEIFLPCPYIYPFYKNI